MRTIKFRAFTERNGGEMIPSEKLVIWDDCFYCNDSMQLHGKIKGFSVTRVMQFTGLIDKNGVEIYEEDILKEWLEDNNEDGGFWWFGIVKFLNGTWKVLEIGFDYKDVFEDMHDLFGNFELTEIAGNSYQNPELLSIPTAVL